MARNVALKVTLNDAQAKTLAQRFNRMSLTDFNQFAQGKGQERDLPSSTLPPHFHPISPTHPHINQQLSSSDFKNLVV